MIECSCRRLTTTDFQNAVDNNLERIEQAPTLTKAIAAAYGVAARAKHTEQSPNCATCPCRETLADMIHKAGFHTDEAYTPKTRTDAPRQVVLCREYRSMGLKNA